MSSSTAGRVLRAEVTAASLDPGAIAAQVGDDAAGAVVTFAGVVRDHDHGRAVTALDYTAHPSASEVIVAVCAEISAEYPATRVAAVHRVGALRIGDVAIVCAVASAHRADAFAACARLVDELKARLPIWKEQYFADGGSEWVGAL
ncbi:molybdenum cofactor biosynthesis protein MoaE [Microbacterium sp.]|uniref:molybdenum cofactor biosynthesis protein MoaE n=1 Tax=Microbacterium sp. TaxID=51671 RepID=UPI003C7632BB